MPGGEFHSHEADMSGSDVERTETSKYCAQRTEELKDTREDIESVQEVEQTTRSGTIQESQKLITC